MPNWRWCLGGVLPIVAATIGWRAGLAFYGPRTSGEFVSLEASLLRTLLAAAAIFGMAFLLNYHVLQRCLRLSWREALSLFLGSWLFGTSLAAVVALALGLLSVAFFFTLALALTQGASVPTVVFPVVLISSGIGGLAFGAVFATFHQPVALLRRARPFPGTSALFGTHCWGAALAAVAVASSVLGMKFDYISLTVSDVLLAFAVVPHVFLTARKLSKLPRETFLECVGNGAFALRVVAAVAMTGVLGAGLARLG